MILKTTVTKKETVEREIETPYFCKETSAITGINYMAVGDDNMVVRVYNSKGYTSIVKTTVNQFESEIGNSEEISQQEFLNAYMEALLFIEPIKVEELV